MFDLQTDPKNLMFAPDPRKWAKLWPSAFVSDNVTKDGIIQ